VINAFIQCKAEIKTAVVSVNLLNALLPIQSFTPPQLLHPRHEKFQPQNSVTPSCSLYRLAGSFPSAKCGNLRFSDHRNRAVAICRICHPCLQDSILLFDSSIMDSDANVDISYTYAYTHPYSCNASPADGNVSYHYANDSSTFERCPIIGQS